MEGIRLVKKKILIVITEKCHVETETETISNPNKNDVDNGDLNKETSHSHRGLKTDKRM